jgi:uncharacterized protein
MQSAAGRIVTLDVIRGIAVMGIFSVNVVAMAMVQAAYSNPTVHGFDTLADRAVWLLNFILVDHKLRSLFSMLFGASTLLVMERAAAAGQSPALAHLARMASLLLLGLGHYYFLWWGDILTLYAMVGIVALAFTPLPARALLIIACLLIAWDMAPRLATLPDWYACGDAPASAMQPGQKCEGMKARRLFYQPTLEPTRAMRRW